MQKNILKSTLVDLISVLAGISTICSNVIKFRKYKPNKYSKPNKHRILKKITWYLMGCTLLSSIPIAPIILFIGITLTDNIFLPLLLTISFLVAVWIPAAQMAKEDKILQHFI
ncbi:hypothetical protein [Sphingobacterium sp. 18053]|uniref:hypothetical protein n=1 Tax=Sphingobacterium sp. 18053 TaxID=2681401 RepID=UPI00135AA792|nr:hypothetical protein [Sphingobacterium sp. 18053]